MSSPNHSTSDIEDALSSMNILNYTSVSSDYFPASSGSISFNSSENSNMIPLVFSPFYNNPCLKDNYYHLRSKSIKGKKKIEEEDESDMNLKAALSNEYDFIQARIEADRLLALRLQDEERKEFTKEERAKISFMIQLQLQEVLAEQRALSIGIDLLTKKELRSQMMTYLKHVRNKKHSDLKNKTFKEIQALYEKVKRFDESFTVIGSNEDERKIKEMNEGASDPDKKKKVVKEDVLTKVPAKQEVVDQGTKKRKGTIDSEIMERKGTIDSEIMERKSVIARLNTEIVRWRLYEAYGVYILDLEDGTVIHMLVERSWLSPLVGCKDLFSLGLTKVTPDPLKKLKGVPSLTPGEQEAADIMQALKESKKTNKRQLGTRGSSEGTGTIPRVLDESIVVSTTSSKGTGTKPRVPNEEQDITKENVILEWGLEQESDDHISDIQDTDDKDDENEYDEYEIYKYKIHVRKDEDEEMLNVEVEDPDKGDEEVTDAAKADAEKTSEVKDDAKNTKLPPTSSSLSVSLDVFENIRNRSLVKLFVALKTQVPFFIDNYLGSKVGDTPTVDLEQESEKSPSEILKIKKEQAKKQKMSKFTIKSTDKATLKEYD
ncbi:hypothetical protein Tco_0238395 [Tanacetum coccineum]